MKREERLSIVCGLIGLMIFQYAVGNGDHKYIGVKKCTMCHKSKKRGEQILQWKRSEHSKAFVHLGTQDAKQVARKAGVDGDPQQNAECLSCHVTGYHASVSQKTSSLTMEEGISCEACHGPGFSYWKMATMKKLAAGELDPKDVGLIKPTEELCRKCHNEKSPTFVGFNFKEAYKEILHERPKAGKSK